jgi:hypothetical protein
MKINRAIIKTILAGMLFSASLSWGQELILKPEDKGEEGAQIQLRGAGEYQTWYYDVYKNRVRWFTQEGEKAEISYGDYNAVNLPGSVNGNGTMSVANIMGNGVYPVTSFGASANDQYFDCTASFQYALDFTAEKGGGAVLIPPGRYWLKGNLNIPTGVTLLGSWEGKHSDNIAYGTNNAVRGSILYVNNPGGDENGAAFITLNQNATIKGVTIYYPNQTVSSFLPYPWTIYCSDYDANVIDVTIVNPYQGIKAKSGHVIRNVFMGALKKGIEVDSSYCLGRIEDVTIHPRPWYPYLKNHEEEKVIWQRMMANLEGYVFKRADWEYVTNCFIIFANVGMRFMTSDKSSATVAVVNYGSDDSHYALKVEAATPWWGASFQNCQFMGKTLIEAEGTTVKFSNCTFMGGFNPIFSEQYHTTSELFIKKGSSVIHLNSCSFPSNAHGVVYNGDYITMEKGMLLANNCDFHSTASKSTYHIKLTDKKQANASVVNSIFKQAMRIQGPVAKNANIIIKN